MSLQDFQPLMLDVLLLFCVLQVLVVDLIMPHGRKRALGYMTAVLLALVFAVSFFVDTSGTAFFGAYQGGTWPLFFKRIFLGIGVIVTLGSIDYVDRYFSNRQGEFYMIMLSSLLGMTVLPGAQNLVLLMVCFELMGIPLVILAAFAKTEDPTGPGKHGVEAALKLYLVSAVSTAVTLFGLSLVFGMAGSTDLSVIAQTAKSPVFTLGIFLTLAGMGFKVGAVPFHMWVPDAYQGAPLPVVTFMSVAPKAAGLATLMMLFVKGFGSVQGLWLPMLLVILVVTMVLGNLLALPQRDVKRMLAYSGIAQMGYMLIPLAVGDSYSIATLLFYLVGYAVTNMGAFLVVMAVTQSKTHEAPMSDFDGLAHRAPGLALAMLLFLLSLAGIPFVVGFWAKLYVFSAAYQAGHGWLVLLGALFAVVALFYYLQLARAMYMKPVTNESPVKYDLGLKVAIAVCILAVVGIGAWPQPFLESARLASLAFAG